MGKKRKSPQYDIDTIRQAGSGRWVEVLSQVTGIDREFLTGKHGPCPKCGGKDRFRMLDEATGGLICNSCFSTRNGDAFAADQWFRGVGFQESLVAFAEYLGVKPSESRGRPKKDSRDPEENLDFLPWLTVAVRPWCRLKDIDEEVLIEYGARCAYYRNRYLVIALPHFESFESDKIVGWTLYNANGKKLPTWQNSELVWEKMKLTAGSKRGLIRRKR